MLVCAMHMNTFMSSISIHLEKCVFGPFGLPVGSRVDTAHELQDLAPSVLAMCMLLVLASCGFVTLVISWGESVVADFIWVWVGGDPQLPRLPPWGLQAEISAKAAWGCPAGWGLAGNGIRCSPLARPLWS